MAHAQKRKTKIQPKRVLFEETLLCPDIHKTINQKE